MLVYVARRVVTGVGSACSSKTLALFGKDSPNAVIFSSQQQHSHAHLPSFNPSTWIRFKRVTHTSLCASRITCKEGSSRPANMTVQKSFLLSARKRSQEIEEDTNKIRTRFFRFFKSHPMLLTVERPDIDIYGLFYFSHTRLQGNNLPK